ncbi:MAG: type II toxin-antitoxin system prevent-host-death family antitoxin [Bacillota bacterium]
MRLATQKLRQQLSAVLDRIVRTDERVQVQRWGRPAAALVGLHDFRRLQVLKRRRPATSSTK